MKESRNTLSEISIDEPNGWHQPSSESPFNRTRRRSLLQAAEGDPERKKWQSQIPEARTALAWLEWRKGERRADAPRGVKPDDWLSYLNGEIDVATWSGRGDAGAPRP